MCAPAGVGQREFPSAFSRQQLPDDDPCEYVHVHHAAVSERRLEQGTLEFGPVHRAHVQHDLRGDGPRASARQLPVAQGVLQRSDVHGRAVAQRVSDVRGQSGAGEAQEHVEKKAGRKEANGRLLTVRPRFVSRRRMCT